MSYYIPIDYIDVYKKNIAEFRKQWLAFQNVVFDKADEVTASLDSTTTEA